MPRSTTGQFLRVVILCGFLLCAASLAAPVFAQPPANNPNEMCGDGTTFTVQLPGTTLGIDDSDGLFQSISVPDVAGADSVTLPNGCRVYAIFISGYSSNRDYTAIPFFKVAEFVAKHNGYVHVGWWNNLTKEYLEGPLHPENIVIRRLLQSDEVIYPGPSTDFDPRNFAPLTNILDRPKANPDDDYQFQSDAALVIQAIRMHNPDAIILVAGHSMGGNAVTRLGLNLNVSIDLLAPIDPVGNRDKPRGMAGQRNFNWTRWRVSHRFRGYKQWDCVRTGGALNVCKDFDSRLFHTSYQCVPYDGDGWLEVPPVIPTRAPIACPKLLPYVDPGSRIKIGTNIKRLYHRWQHEFLWPVDFLQTERFNHSQPLASSVLGPNYQEPFLPNTNPLALDPNKTCPFPEDLEVPDPRDPNFTCASTDGHGEVIGHRGTKGELRPGLKMEGNWPSADIPGNVLNSADRRVKIIELATADAFWPHRPQNPDLCMVCDDMITILQHLLAQQPQPPTLIDDIAPVSIAVATPGPGPAGWNNEDVVVDFAAVDEQNGSGVKEIETSLSGAQFGSMLTAGASAQETVTAEGKTIVSFLARDNAGNAETAQMLNVWIDKTPPAIAAITDSDPNANGWFRTVVLVSFPASDEVDGSGLATSSADVPVSTEGAGQEITGTAVDNAGNTASAAVTLSIDLTPPGIALASRTPAANAAGWNNTDVTFTWDCTDALSGPASPADSKVVSTEGAAQMVIGACMDLADNVASDTQSGINVDRTNPAISITTPADGATYLLNAAVNADYNCTDAPSGVQSCNGPVASGAPVNTASVGNKQFAVNASDVADNSASSTHNYSVHYVFSGFANPIGPMPMVNVVKAGRTVPIKYYLQDASSAFITNLASFVSLMSAPIACDSEAPGVLAEETDAAGSTAIRYDAAANQFIYNWKTDASWAGTCRALQLTLSDGTQRLAVFRFQ